MLEFARNARSRRKSVSFHPSLPSPTRRDVYKIALSRRKHLYRRVCRGARCRRGGVTPETIGFLQGEGGRGVWRRKRGEIIGPHPLPLLRFRRYL